MKAVKRNDKNGNFYAYLIECPACKSPHVFDKRWTFNGDYNKPTFSPSMKSSWGGTIDPVSNRIEVPEQVCHSFVRDGKIEFLNDCTHDMKNSVVELPEINEDYFNG